MKQVTTTPSNRKLIAAGGGSTQDERPLLELFAEWTGTEGKVLFLPIAQAGSGRSFAGSLDWVSAGLKTVGMTNITMWTDLTAEDHSKLAEFDAIFIGGGNTYSLLDQIQKSGFDKSLLQFIARGGVVYGGSAGAILLGSDILTCAHLDENIVGLTDTRGLNMMGGYCIWCHYVPEDDVRITEYAKRRGLPVLALSERSGVSANDGILTACGLEPTYVFTSGNVQTFGVGETIALPN